MLSYAYTIYNPKKTPAGGQPSLTRVLRLYREGKLLVDSPEKPLQNLTITDKTRIEDFGTITLTGAVAAGEYVLQITIRDKTTNKTSTQWIDFEVID